jgi:hypothetical protein
MGGTRRLGQSPRGMWAKQGPTLLDDRRRSRASTPGLRFDVVVIALKNAGGFNIRGLPIHVILGRPAFVIFDTVGSVEAIAQAHALMEAWGLRKLEVSLLLFRKRNIRNANLAKGHLPSAHHCRRNDSEFEQLWGVVSGAVFWRYDCCSGHDKPVRHMHFLLYLRC